MQAEVLSRDSVGIERQAERQGEKVKEMLKALATITTWVLFVFALVQLLGAAWGYMTLNPLIFGGATCFMLAVCQIKIRQMLK